MEYDGRDDCTTYPYIYLFLLKPLSAPTRMFPILPRISAPIKIASCLLPTDRFMPVTPSMGKSRLSHCLIERGRGLFV